MSTTPLTPTPGFSCLQRPGGFSTRASLTCCSELHNAETLRRVKVVFTDQDGQLVVSVTKKQTQKHSWLRNVSYRLCAWHKLDRNLTELKECRALTSVLNEDSSCEWNAIVSWLWMLAKRPETPYKLNLLFVLLKLHLEDDQTHHRGIIGPDLKNLLTDFLGKSFTDEAGEIVCPQLSVCDDFGEDHITSG